MNTTAVIRFIKQAVVATIAAACVQAYAQESVDPGITVTDPAPVSDPYNPGPGTPFTLTIDNQPIYTLTYNSWYNADSFYPPHCGIIRSYSVHGYDVLQPGVYQAKVTQAGRTLATATLTLPPCVHPVDVYSARHDAYTDNFYTTSMSQLQQALALGYQNTGIGFRVAPSSQKTAPWKRYFIGSPPLEHFYTHLPDEEQFVTSFGYGYERDEGNVFTSQLAGTLPLYRLTQYFPSNGDLEHVYTTSTAAVASYQQAGYTPEGIKGYVCP